MGYAQYDIDGELCGYAVPDVCHESGCTTEIDRGLAYACGGYPGEGDGMCGGYFCSEHLFLSDDPDLGFICRSCLTEEVL